MRRVAQDLCHRLAITPSTSDAGFYGATSYGSVNYATVEKCPIRIPSDPVEFPSMDTAKNPNIWMEIDEAGFAD